MCYGIRTSSVGRVEGFRALKKHASRELLSCPCSELSKFCCTPLRCDDSVYMSYVTTCMYVSGGIGES